MPQKSAGRGTYAPVQHQQHGLLANPLAPRRGLGHHNVDLGGVPEGVSCAKYRIAGTNQYAMRWGWVPSTSQRGEFLIGAGNKDFLRVGLKNRSGRGGGRASLRLMW